MPHKDPIKRREYARQYIQKNRKEHNTRNKNWRDKNKEYGSEYQKEYRKKNAENENILLAMRLGLALEDGGNRFSRHAAAG